MAKNTTKLGVAEIFYIQQNPENLTAQALAEKLGRSLNVVKRYLAEAKPKVEAIVEPPKEPEITPQEQQSGQTKGINARRAFGHVRKKGQSLATVMTPAASEIGDEASKQNRRKLNDIPALRNAIHKPYGDIDGE